MDLSEMLAEVCWTPDLFLVCFVSVGRHSLRNIVQTLSGVLVPVGPPEVTKENFFFFLQKMDRHLRTFL